MSSEIERVAALADVMREKGIRHLRIADVEIDLGPRLDQSVAPTLAPDTVSPPPGASLTEKPHSYESVMLPAEALCRCGHEMVLHDENGCQVSGSCSIEACSKTTP